MHILISPNAFKNSLDASAAAHAIEEGLQQSGLECITQCFPIGDGGDGTGTLLTKACNGFFVTETVHDPLGRLINASMGLIDDGQTAVIEMASASGLQLVKKEELNPLKASSFGTGELMLKALARGVIKILLCVGGSATVDGGSGILQALGIQFLNKEGDLLEELPENLIHLYSINISGLDKRMKACECVILCDVTNPLLGEKGAANIFGPQKGATAAMVFQLEASLTQLARIIKLTNGKDIVQLTHGGAAGGVAAGLFALLNAQLVNGIDYFLDTAGFDEAIETADLLITGEGSIDLQTLDGKAPYGVAVRAKKKNIPVIAMTGKLQEPVVLELNQFFDTLICINEDPFDMETVLTSTKKNLIRCSTQYGKSLI